MRNERGQATTEYMLMLMIAMGLVVMLLRDVIKPTFARLQAALSARMENALFGNGSFHRFPVGKGSP